MNVEKYNITKQAMTVMKFYKKFKDKGNSAIFNLNMKNDWKNFFYRKIYCYYLTMVVFHSVLQQRVWLFGWSKNLRAVKSNIT